MKLLPTGIRYLNMTKQVLLHYIYDWYGISEEGRKENTNKGITLCDKAIEMDPALASLKQKKMTMGL